MGAVIYLDQGNIFDLEEVGTFSPMNGNKSFVYNSKNVVSEAIRYSK